MIGKHGERAVRISEIRGVIQTVCNFSHEFHLNVEILQELENTVHSYRSENSCLPSCKTFHNWVGKRTQIII